MSQHRIKRLEEEIRHAVSSILLFTATDPLVKGVTITRVVLTRDLGIARVYYEAAGSETKRKEIQAGLDRARGFVRRELADRVTLKMIPEVQFFYDETSDEISRIEGLFAKL